MSDSRFPNFNDLKLNVSSENLVGIDIETTAIDPITSDVEKIWCISWDYPSGESKSVFWKDGIPKEDLTFLFSNSSSLAVLVTRNSHQTALLAELKDILTGQTKYVPCFHNAQFDKRHLSECGIHIPKYHDTMVMAFCCFPPTLLSSSDADDAMRFYSLRYLGDMGLCDAKLEFSSEWSEFTEKMLTYNKGDAKSCRQLGQTFLEILVQDPRTFNAYIIDLCCTEMCLEMTRNGVHIDMDALTELTIKKEKQFEELSSELKSMCPAVATKERSYARPKLSDKIHPRLNGIYNQSEIGSFIEVGKKGSDFIYREVEQFNPNSSDHLIIALTHHCDFKPTKFNKKTGKPSTAKDVIEELSRFKFASVLLQYRKVEKLLSTYLKPFRNTSQINRIHPSFLTCATKTSRLASRGPNFQNLPRGDVRTLVSARSDEYRIVCIDLSQIELRILAWDMAMILKDTYLWNIYELNEDVHSANQKNMGLENDKQNGRKYAKIGIFLYIYGGGPSKLAAQIGVPVSEAKLIMSKLERNVPGLPKLKKVLENTISEKKLIRTKYGHKICYPDLDSGVRSKVARSKRQAFNARIQGSQADIIKILMWQARKPMETFGADILIQVHDEIVYEVPVGNVPWFCEHLTKIFNTRKLLPGMKVQATPGVGRTWSEAKKDGEEREKANKEKVS